ncbi:hypothetical protein [Mesorhizobium sp.]|uniref:hypothetical protein n=1 Tax=Mesorhizobium sp. TaxID=1871066 RepID=UPI000FE7B6DF|nr:hypothetical protein [Mesorhizobium sp.]RWI20339.1 MAG: hypothetical protein EOQ92_20670 [Mesorhizobium sp.]RWK47679.1 MAG: hypothetical protein EOR47_20715 [Mesorhizobium sp.]RWK95539.1 MAG: hypothetical protein EOR53_12810 [Mesorhizobium sp.]TIP55243.1 MAG: hypothetical protein E5X56_29625 [Mesorhizobium sp.]TIQ28479.1 MAG: hypothetical protein E5X54_17815 [Mesorhizobium sp.]
MSTIPIVEPCVCSDVFVTGAGPLTFMGDNLRLSLFVSQRSYDGSPENAVVAKLVGSRADMLQIAAAIMRGCSGEVADSFVDFLEAPSGRH